MDALTWSQKLLWQRFEKILRYWSQKHIQFNKSVEEEATVEEQETLVTEKLKSLTVHGAQAAGATSAAAMSQPIISSSVDPKLGEFAPTPCLLHD